MEKKKHRKKNRRITRQLPTEDRRTEALTVAWTLSTMVTLCALFSAGFALLTIPLLAGDIGPLGIMPRLLLAVATVTGTVSFILMACTLRFRRSPPPRLIVIVSTAICFFPLGVHLLLAFR